MTKVQLTWDERYPVFDYALVSEPLKDDTFDVDEDTLARWGSVFEAYEQVQKELQGLLDDAY